MFENTEKKTTSIHPEMPFYNVFPSIADPDP
jgi:hypothetical protein